MTAWTDRADGSCGLVDERGDKMEVDGEPVVIEGQLIPELGRLNG